MAITKQVSNESIEVSGQYKIIGVKKVTTVSENGDVISRSNHRTTYSPNTDVATLDADVAEIANLVWTQAVKDSYQAYLDSIPVAPIPE
jgi:uncharacterized protein related to proFAR isomerase